MSMKTVLLRLLFFLALSYCGASSAGTWYVNAGASEPRDGLSPETGFEKIQEGIDAAEDGDTVIVAEGTYVENIQFNGKNIVLRSSDPLDPDVVKNTIIDGNQAGSVVTFAGTESEKCILSGFTVQNGQAERGGGISGATWDEAPHTHATVQNNIIAGNSAGEGGGLAFCDGTVQNNTIKANWALAAGGLRSCDGTIKNNLIARNAANWGGGLAYCEGTIQNNTIYRNSAGYGGGGLCWCFGTIRNCIIWGNGAGKWGDQLYESNAPSFSCIQGWTGGEGNIGEDPRLVDPAVADFRLQAGSPCIDAGANYYWFRWPQRDLGGNCRLVGERIDMGCYEYGSSPDSDGDLFCDADELLLGTDRTNDDTDGDGLRDGLELLRGSDPFTATPGRLVHVPSELSTIQESLCVAADGDEIVVAPGTYQENLFFCGANVVVRSSDPQDLDIVASTTMEGGARGPVVSFLGTEGDACVLSGFTIRDGRAECGGGICGGTLGNHTHATIQNNVVRDNSARGDGGGLAYCDGRIENNTITGNSAKRRGGGLAYCDARIQKNRVAGNLANSGGGLCRCRGTIRNNIITGNSAGDGGGGLAYCEGTIRNNTIYGNWALYGGGLYECQGTIENNKITGNSVEVYGGGLCRCQGRIENNTIAGNEGWGGLWRCNGTIRNCIVWGNGGADWRNEVYESSTPTYSCIRGWTEVGTVIGDDPLFVDEAGGDYHLRGDSPCIDAGANGYWFVWPQRDLDGNCRVAGERIEMGCYEYGSFPDSDGDLLSDAQESAAGTDPRREDTDGDGLRDGLEILRRSDPLGATLPGILHVPSGVPTIQEALVVALSGDEIVAAPATYRENIQFFGVDVILRSSDPENPDVVASTIIDGSGERSVVSFTGGESEACALAGFTIRNGRGECGGAICGGTEHKHSHATVENNVITGNSAGRYGGGLARCDGTIQNNVITGNSADYGGGLNDCNGIIRNSTITGNSAWDGGGLAHCEATIVNCIIWGNTAPEGAQLYDSSEPAYCCIEAWTGGGEGNISEDPRFVDSDGADNDPETYGDNDYHLRPDSPCIDAGTHEVVAPPNTDMDGELRPFGPEIDIGADEYVDADRDELPDYWELDHFGILWLGREDDVDADGLPNGEEFVRTTDPNHWDTDADRQSDGNEVFAGTDPLDAESLFGIIEIAYTPWGAAVMWSAVPFRSYQCYLGSDVETWYPVGGRVTGGAFDTSLSIFDWGSAVLRRCYYKVEVLP